jgi:23S rRNA pseudouridine2457 synthase
MSYIRHMTCPCHLCIIIPPFATEPAQPGVVRVPASRTVYASGLASIAGLRMRLLALNKPFGTICQFSPHETRASLADWVKVPGVYPAGRLDSDSEGLLLLTDDGALQARIAEPRHKLVKRYWAQVEGAPDETALTALASGVDLGDYVTRPCHVQLIEPSATEALWPRNPPIRYRAAIPTTWIELSITEGKNRQVRRMTAAVGFPTLRLVRVGIGVLDIFSLGLAPGASLELPARAPWDGLR